MEDKGIFEDSGYPRDVATPGDTREIFATVTYGVRVYCPSDCATAGNRLALLGGIFTSRRSRARVLGALSIHDFCAGNASVARYRWSVGPIGHCATPVAIGRDWSMVSWPRDVMNFFLGTGNVKISENFTHGRVWIYILRVFFSEFYSFPKVRKKFSEFYHREGIDTFLKYFENFFLVTWKVQITENFTHGRM